jgi:hypothetical protein
MVYLIGEEYTLSLCLVVCFSHILILSFTYFYCYVSDYHDEFFRSCCLLSSNTCVVYLRPSYTFIHLLEMYTLNRYFILFNFYHV